MWIGRHENPIVAFHNFANAPKKLSSVCHGCTSTHTHLKLFFSLSLFSEASLRSLILIMRLITAV
jgi:hypothetical protein